MKYLFLFITLWCMLPLSSRCQTDAHYTMFMYNKMYYNPAYTANREVTSITGYYRNQWSAIEGAPKTMGVAFEAPLGSRDQSPKQIGIGLTVNSEQIGVEKKQDVFGNYAFRFRMDNESILSFGIRAGAQLYSADYTQLNPYQQNDPNLQKNVANATLFNFGLGFFWHNEDCYVGGSIPDLVENYYDKNEKGQQNTRARQARGYYLSGGYVFHSGDDLDILPQVMARYVNDGTYTLPFSCDLNVSFFLAKRLMLGVTYRTDKSFEGLVHMQVAKSLSVGYAYDYVISPLNGYTNGAHEVVLGFDFAGRKYERYDKVHYLGLF